MKSSPGRILAVTAGLLAGGALFGAIAAVLALVVASALTDGLAWGTEPIALVFAAVAGAALGAPLFPAAGWLLLRRVPLGVALVGSMAGTVLGGVLGWVLTGGNDPMATPILGAIIGFACAAILMRLRFSTPRKAEAIRIPRGAGV
jgi:hypothetical protein